MEKTHRDLIFRDKFNSLDNAVTEKARKAHLLELFGGEDPSILNSLKRIELYLSTTPQLLGMAGIILLDVATHPQKYLQKK